MIRRVCQIRTAHRPALRWPVVLGGVCLLAAPSQAQRLGLDVASGDVRLRGQPASGALMVAPALNASSGLGVLDAQGGLLLVNGRAVRTQLVATATGRPWRLGLAPVVRLFGADDQVALTGRSQRLDGEFGAMLGSPALGATLMAGVAQAAHGGAVRGLQTNRLGVHVASRGLRLAVAYVGNTFDAPMAEQAAMIAGAAPQLRQADLTTEATWGWRRLEVGGFAGRRVSGQAAMMPQAPWGGAHVRVALGDRVSIIARHESTPSDPSRHLPGQRLSTIGFRLTPSARHARFDDGSSTRTPAREFTVAARGAGDHLLRVHAPEAQQVELSGSFLAWQPVPMRRAGGGWWELEQRIAPGVHQFNVRIDGGRWMVPAGTQVAQDEFNGEVGVLLIAPDAASAPEPNA